MKKKLVVICTLGLLIQISCTKGKSAESLDENKEAVTMASQENETTNEEKTSEDKASEAPAVEKETGAEVDHKIWNDLLKDNVSKDGVVDYGGMKKSEAKLDEYLNIISTNPPAKSWSENETFAYWINAYNAFTVKLILDNEEENIKSIKDIGPKIQVPFVNTPWDIKFITIGGEKFDLNNIEHGKVRKQFDDPRFHFALVCAAESCPKLRNEAYTANKIDKQLDDQAEAFLNSDKNEISDKKVKISPLFKWYSGDFEAKMPIAEWINKYSKTKIDPNETKFDYMNYSWKLNGSF